MQYTFACADLVGSKLPIAGLWNVILQWTAATYIVLHAVKMGGNAVHMQT